MKIKRSYIADTRYCDCSKVTKEELLLASLNHIDDVRQGLDFFIDKIKNTALLHDITKTSDIDMFHNDFKTGFKNNTWHKMHQTKERHHLKETKYIQDDVNLIDVLEMIVDGIMAGLARRGEYHNEEVSDTLLRKAYDNTIKLLLDNVQVED